MTARGDEGPDLGPDENSIWAALADAVVAARAPASGERRDVDGGWRVAMPGAEVPVSFERSGGTSTATACLPAVASVVTGEGPDDAAALAALALDVARSGRRACLLAPGEDASALEAAPRSRRGRGAAADVRRACEAVGLPFDSPGRALAALVDRLRRDADELAGMRAELERIEAAHVDAASRRDQWKMRCEELEAEVASLRGGAARAKAAALDAILAAQRSVLAFDPAEAEPPHERLARSGWLPCDAGRALWRHPLFRGGEPTDVARALAVCAAWAALG